MNAAAVRPYMMDLGSTNGTFLNNERLEPTRYYELLEQVLAWPCRQLQCPLLQVLVGDEDVCTAYMQAHGVQAAQQDGG